MTASQGTGGALAGWDDVQGSQSAPTLEYSELPTGGAIVKHVASKNIEKAGKSYRLHTFQSAGGMGQVFALWGSAQLNAKIRELRPGAIIFLQYGGKQPMQEDAQLPAEQQRTEHVFIVKQAPKGADVIGIRRQFDESALEKIIRLAIERERAARAAGRGGEQAPPHDDADFPYGENARP